jgi:ribose transport system substrate-binding protein
MKRSKVLAAGAGLLLAATALSACGAVQSAGPGGSSDDSGDGGDHTWIKATVKDGKIDLGGQTCVSLFTTFKNDYYASWSDGADEVAKQLNCKLVKLTNEGDQETQLSQMQQQINAGAKIFFNTSNDPSALPGMAKLATDNKVCMAQTWEMPAWTSPWTYGNGLAFYQAFASEDGSYKLAKMLFDKMGGKGNFVWLTGHPGGTPDEQRIIGVNRALEEYPDIKLVASEPGEWNREDSRDAMAGIIAKYGKDIDGVYGQNDDVAIGAINAMKEAGITGVPVVGMDGNKGTMDLIKSGDMFASYSALPFWQAGFSLVQAVDWCLGGDLGSPLNRQTLSDGLIVTKDNVDQYLTDYFSGSLPYDYNKMSRVANPDSWDPQNGVVAVDMDKAWAFEDKPSGFEYPKPYADAIGDIDEVDAEWNDHWKLFRTDAGS